MLDKLSIVFGKESFSEENIVYFFVLLGKFLEVQKKKNTYPTLWFYRCWVCHAFLDKDTDKIFEEIYVVIKAESVLGHMYTREEEPTQAEEVLKKVFSQCFAKRDFLELKRELDIFSSTHLPDATLNWESFRRMLYNHLVGTPLRVNDMAGEKVFEMNLCLTDEAGRFDEMQINLMCGGRAVSLITTDTNRPGSFEVNEPYREEY